MSDEEVRRHWDANAPTWARHVRAGYDVCRDYYTMPAFLEFVGDLAGQEVLDAGCGEGLNTREFARRGARVTGADISAAMIALARAEEEREPLGIDYLVASMSDMGELADGSFDAVLSTMALMDCADYEGAVREFWRVLRPGGMLAYTLLHPCFTYGAPRWERNEAGEATARILGNYFAGGASEERWSFGAAPEEERREPFTVIYFERTLSDLINPLCEQGFRIEALHEPRATDEACRLRPRLRDEQLVPLSLCVKCRKPAG